MTELNNKADSDKQVDNDKLLDMFLDKDFVPQSYVDVLLSATSTEDLTKTQAVSSALLARFDYYTKTLTNELKTSLESLEKLSETIPSTWSSSTLDKATLGTSEPSNAHGSSKLEYYLETLGSAVRALEADTQSIDEQIKELDSKYQSSDEVVEQLDKLVKVRSRLNSVIKCFQELDNIFSISPNISRNEQDDVSSKSVSVFDFKLSLRTLEETIEESLASSTQAEKHNQRNTELLKKIDHFIELKPIFKGLDKFYPIYSDFVDSISKKMEIYMSTKDIEDGF
ncbi:hypothetical protein TPHA_0F00790 [Tetrapisispora phaffii CBS 4417]|uniref:Uncharacterized protein n=1 Tax=Tetrapisispora phaffii (strain ATCC 24235 / CBS 4417 / NBRC 1672 / NRRL Y-8282 / UCD 70-5) TaxID=1071381 RepID=G8BUY3_TETPH|nr:hypothetical protein TPHA_0F00790 [Tetrapisispora phaffii CBS 4417]CCE63565.1 hypothetical protein TPHA_0F00790 [Tetrapisispora phaffii CBS 4417]